MPLPKILDIGFKINRKKLRKLDLPVEKILISELEHNLDIPYREKEGTDDRNLTPREFIKNIEKEFHHAEVIKKADISYPIEIFFHKWKRIILDWVHRFTKIVMLWHKTIKVRKIKPEIINLEEYTQRKKNTSYKQ